MSSAISIARISFRQTKKLKNLLVLDNKMEARTALKKKKEKKKTNVIALA